MNPHITFNEFKGMTKKDQKKWVEEMRDHGATFSDMAKLLGISRVAMAARSKKLGFVLPQGRNSNKRSTAWDNYITCCPEYDPNMDPEKVLADWDKAVEDAYVLSDADFEGYAQNMAAAKKDELLKPVAGSARYFGTPAQIAESWFRSMPDRKVMVTISWE